MRPDRDGKHPLRVVMRLTGLSADTLRIWERRHHAVTPARTEGNARRYSDADVERLRRLAAAAAAGHAIGSIASLSDDDLVALAAQARPPSAPHPEAPTDTLVQDYLRALSAFDAATCDRLLLGASARFPAATFALDVVAPILREVGARWHAGALSVAQEHLASQQLRAALERQLRQRAGGASRPRVLFAAPEDHRHELGLLIGAVIAEAHGMDAVVLGGDTPVEELRAAATRADASPIVLAVARDLDGAEVRALPAKLRRLARQSDLWIGLPRGHTLMELADVARLFFSLEELASAFSGRASPVHGGVR